MVCPDRNSHYSPSQQAGCSHIVKNHRMVLCVMNRPSLLQERYLLLVIRRDRRREIGSITRRLPKSRVLSSFKEYKLDSIFPLLDGVRGKFTSRRKEGAAASFSCRIRREFP